MTTIGYCRVSTEDQAKEGVSLDNQKSKIVAYCHLKDLDLSEIFSRCRFIGKEYAETWCTTSSQTRSHQTGLCHSPL